MRTTNAIPYQDPNNSTNNRVGESNFLVYVLVFLVSLAASLCIAILLPRYGLALKFGGPGHDGYLELARSLYNGEGYRFSSDGSAALNRAPLYPLLLVPLMGFSESLIQTGVAILNSVFLLMACVYTRRICRLLFPQAIIGTIAIALLVCNPWVLRLVSSPLSAIMQMALYTALCFYFLQFCENIRQISRRTTGQLFQDFALISLLATAACFAHTTGVFICSAIWLVATLTTLMTCQWKTLVFLVMTAAFTLTALSPWALRNAEALERTELTTGGAGFSYFLSNGYWGVGNGDYRHDQSLELNALRMAGITNPTQSMIEPWGITDAKLDNQLREAMLEHKSNHPNEIIKKSLLNFSDIVFPITHTLYCATGGFSNHCAQSTSAYQMTHRALHSIFMLIIVGLAVSYLLSHREKKTVLLCAALACSVLYIAPNLTIATYAHHGIYSLGALPILCALAAATVYRRRIVKALQTDVENPELVWIKEHKELDLVLIPGLVKSKPDYRQSQAKNDRIGAVEIDHII